MAQSGVGVGAAQHVQPVGAVAERGPHLLPVDSPLVTVEHGLGAHRGEVRSRPGLGEALPPHLLDAEDLRQEPSLLLIGTEASKVGPRSSRAWVFTRAGAAARAYSYSKTISSASPAPRPPYSTGHVNPSQLPAESSRSHATRTSQAVSSVGPPTPRCPRTHRRGALPARFAPLRESLPALALMSNSIEP